VIATNAAIIAIVPAIVIPATIVHFTENVKLRNLTKKTRLYGAINANLKVMKKKSHLRCIAIAAVKNTKKKKKQGVAKRTTSQNVAKTGNIFL
jgi:hypothetical protein